MEKKLAEYRASKNKSNKFNIISEQKSSDNNKDAQKHGLSSLVANLKELLYNNISISNDDNIDSEETETTWIGFVFRKLNSFAFLLKLGLWLCLQLFFIEIQFGAVYFVVSLTLIMYFSMKTNQRKKSEPSAYSVFNKDCERIDGTFTAEQFEKQMIYGGNIR